MSARLSATSEASAAAVTVKRKGRAAGRLTTGGEPADDAGGDVGRSRALPLRRRKLRAQGIARSGAIGSARVRGGLHRGVAHRRDQPIPALRHRLDVPRLLRVVVQRLPQLGDRRRQRRFADEPSLPGDVQQFLFGDHFRWPAREGKEHVDHLRPKPPNRVVTGHDASGRIDAPVADLEHADEEGGRSDT